MSIVSFSRILTPAEEPPARCPLHRSTRRRSAWRTRTSSSHMRCRRREGIWKLSGCNLVLTEVETNRSCHRFLGSVHDYAKKTTSGQNAMKPGGRTGGCESGENPIKCWCGSRSEGGSRSLVSDCFCVKLGVLLTFCKLMSQKRNPWILMKKLREHLGNWYIRVCWI